MLIGLPIIKIKKIVSKKKIHVVPKSNIIRIPSTILTQPEESIEMKTFHTEPRIIQVQPINIIDVNDTNSQSVTSNNENSIPINDSINNSKHGNNLDMMLPLNSPVLCFNTSKSNKNIINFTGMLLISVMFIILGYFTVASRSGWISLREGNIYSFVPICCIPLIFPTMYFMYNPKHLINVLNDLL